MLVVHIFSWLSWFSCPSPVIYYICLIVTYTTSYTSLVQALCFVLLAIEKVITLTTETLKCCLNIVLALWQVSHGPGLNHRSTQGAERASKELHEFEEKHFPNGEGREQPSVEGKKWFRAGKKLSHRFPYLKLNFCWDVLPPHPHR